MHRLRALPASQSFSSGRQREPLSVRPLLAYNERTVSATVRKVLARASRYRDGHAKAGPRPALRHQLGLPPVRDLQGERGQQAANRHLPNNGRHHREAEPAGLRAELLPSVEAQAHLSHLLCPSTALWGGCDAASELLLRYVLLAHEHEQRKSKCVCPLPLLISQPWLASKMLPYSIMKSLAKRKSSILIASCDWKSFSFSFKLLFTVLIEHEWEH